MILIAAISIFNDHLAHMKAQSSARSLALARVSFARLALSFLALSRLEARIEKDDAIELDPLSVVSTGTRSDTALGESPVKTELLTSSDLEATGARDIGAALDYLPGIRSEASCQNCGSAEIKMLGLGAGYSRLLFDGQPLFSGLASIYGIEQVPTSFVSRIEVVKGGVSSLYGPGAIAGVINILPKEPAVNETRYDFSFESVAGEAFTSASLLQDWSTSDGSLAASLYAQRNDNAAVDLDDDGFTEITKKRFSTIGANGWVYMGEEGKLSLNYSYSEEARRGGDALDLKPHESRIAEALEHQWHRGGAAWESKAGSLYYRMSASLSHVRRDSYYGGVGALALPTDPLHEPLAYSEALEHSRLLYGYSQSTRYFADLFFSSSLGSHSLSWGAQYQHDRVFDEKQDDQGRPLRGDGTLAERSGEDPIAAGDFDNLGLYLQDEWRLSERTRLTSGLRLDLQSELDTWILSPRIALNHAASTEWTWLGSLSSGFRAPALFDEDFHIEILEDPTRTRNAADLSEESALSQSAGFRWTPAGDGRRLVVLGEVFRTDIDDTFLVSDIVSIDEQGAAFKERVNSSGSLVQGFELGARYRLGKGWRVEGALTHVDARHDEPVEALEGIFESRYLETPRWSGIAQLRYQSESLGDVFLGISYTGPMIAAREVDGSLNRSTEDFLVLDLTYTKRLEFGDQDDPLRIDLMLGLKNLLDQRQSDLSSGPERDTSYFYGPRYPRSFAARLGATW